MLVARGRLLSSQGIGLSDVNRASRYARAAKSSDREYNRVV